MCPAPRQSWGVPAAVGHVGCASSCGACGLCQQLWGMWGVPAAVGHVGCASSCGACGVCQQLWGMWGVLEAARHASSCGAQAAALEDADSESQASSSSMHSGKICSPGANLHGGWYPAPRR